MKLTLRIAAVYNILWGAWCILFPNHLFDLVGMDRLNHPMVWQGLGMVIGLYGLAYWWASYDPVKYWPIVAVGLLGKIFGPAGFVFNYLLGIVSIGFGYTLITNDIIWWVPFGHILHRAYKETGFRL
ncbi:MAG: alkyl hydroperoxide reductase [Ignavibacteriaceae bacterium]|nr:alkyl hydroperoxide reductase [Ignavibacteriaceae bacterium]